MGYSYIPLTSEEKTAAALLARQVRISPVVAEILYRRGVTDEERLREFLHPQLEHLPDPFSMAGMAQAVQTLVRARLSGHPVYIHGDYDVDGITSTALLQDFFTGVGIHSSWYIPKRTEEQYGLSTNSLAKLLKGVHPRDRAVLITVDCGISALAEARLAKEDFGCADIIITDHHLPGAELPDATAIINPKLPGCGFSFPHLAGVGVAFLLVCALRRALVESGALRRENMPNLKQALDLVALGTIADVVPLIDVNRTLVRAGLEMLGERRRAGVAALAEIANVRSREITAEDVAFRLAPRINACGRLGQPDLGVRLLLAHDRQSVRLLAREMDGLNTRRKSLENSIYPAIEAACEQQIEAGRVALTVYNPDCHPGILGILASRMVERFGTPVIVFTKDLQTGADKSLILKGSGRSIPGINLYERIAECVTAIEQFGGHPMAAGLTIEAKRLEEFAELFNQCVAQRNLGDAAENEDTLVDYEVDADFLFERDFQESMLLMEPCGEGNPEPVFLLPPEPLRQVRTVGNHAHVVFQIETRGRVMSGVGFNLAQQYAEFPGNESSLVFKLKKRCVRGREHPQMQVIKFLPEA